MRENQVNRRDLGKTWQRPTSKQHEFLIEHYRCFLLEMEDLHFHHNSAVMLPDYVADSSTTQNEDRITGLSVLSTCYHYAQSHPDQKLLLAGHTDTSGADNYNLLLSEMRADNVLFALQGDKTAWARSAEQKHKVEDYQQILKWIAAFFGWDCDPGDVDDHDNAETRAAVRAFQQRFNDEFSASLAVDGVVGRQTWGAFFDMYMEGLKHALPANDQALTQLRSGIHFLSSGQKDVGCGKNFPREAQGVQNYRSATNRRVELLFFEPGQEPNMACHPHLHACSPARCEIYNHRKYTILPIPVLPLHDSRVAPLIALAGPAPAGPAPAGAAPAGPGAAPAGAVPAPAGAGATPAGPGAGPAPGTGPAAGAGPAPAGAGPAPAGAGNPPPTTAPSVTPAAAAVVVKKPYTNPARQPVVLRTDTPFDGTGTFTRSNNKIHFFTALTSGTEITFNGTDNVFPGAQLTAGVTVFAEGATASAALNDVVLRLTLTPGSAPVRPPVEARMTCVELTLDICMSRTAAATDPAILPAPAAGAAAGALDKINTGRFIHVQDPAFDHGRAKLIIHQAVPAAFAGNLELTAVDARVQIFPTETTGPGDAPLALPRPFTNTTIPADGMVVWAQGAQASAALRDSGFRLGIEGGEHEGDLVRVTVVRFHNFRADVPITRQVHARFGNSPVPRHQFDKATAATADNADFSDDYTINKPLVLITDSVPAADAINLSVQVQPPNTPVLWDVVRRDTRPAPDGDDAQIIALSANPVPTLTTNAATPLQATLLADAVGSFRIRPYVDGNNNNLCDVDADHEPFLLMNYILARVEGVTNNSRHLPTAPTLQPPAGGNIQLNTGTFASGAAASINNRATVKVTGGGGDGKRGLNQIFAGWIQNIPRMDAFAQYLDTTPAPPLPPLTHTVRWIFHTGATGATINPPGPPTLTPLPLLDVSPHGETPGAGGNSAVGTEAATASPPGPPGGITKVDLPAGQVGQNWTIQQFDSPSLPVPTTHPNFPGVLSRFRHNIDFRTELCFWTSVRTAAAPTPTAAGGPACRLYSSVQTNLWNVRAEFTFNAAGVATVVTAPAINLTRDANATRQATPVQGSGLEVRGPSALDRLAVDAST